MNTGRAGEGHQRLFKEQANHGGASAAQSSNDLHFRSGINEKPQEHARLSKAGGEEEKS